MCSFPSVSVSTVVGTVPLCTLALNSFEGPHSLDQSDLLDSTLGFLFVGESTDPQRVA